MAKKIFIISFSIILVIFLISTITTQTDADWGKQSSEDSFEENFRHGYRGRELSFRERDNFRHLGKYLDLTTEQRQKMHKIRYDFIKKTIDLEDELGQKRLKRRALMEKDTIDWKKADQLTDEIADLRAKLQKKKMRQRPEIKKILTLEQLEKFEEMKGWKERSRCNIASRKGFGHGQGQGRGLGW